MGFTPQEVDRMSLFQWRASVEGFVRANSPGEKLSEREADELFDWLERDAGPRRLSTQTYVLDGELLVPAGMVEFEV